jgi:hypothetical protein
MTGRRFCHDCAQMQHARTVYGGDETSYWYCDECEATIKCDGCGQPWIWDHVCVPDEEGGA